MRRRAVICVTIALLLAGCVGGQGGAGTTTPPTTDATTVAPSDGTTEATIDETTDATSGEATDGATGESADGSALQFYLSDEENAMDDFAHLNVSVTKVGLKRTGGDAGWTTYDVENRSIDLTRLRGANATRLGTFGVENGTYETVFVHVGEVNGTLTNGEQVRVKLPSQKLQIHQQFSVGPNESVDYVFDISVFAAGKSGKYILKPVVSESGTDKEIEDVDEKKEDDDDGKKGDEKGDDEQEDKTDDGNGTDDADESALNATFVGNVTRGGNATVAVTRNGTAVANATVEVEGESVGETQSDGTLTFSVPDREEIEVEVETEDGSVELTKRFGQGDDGDDQRGGGNGSGNGNGN